MILSCCQSNLSSSLFLIWKGKLLILNLAKDLLGALPYTEISNKLHAVENFILLFLLQDLTSLLMQCSDCL